MSKFLVVEKKRHKKIPKNLGEKKFKLALHEVHSNSFFPQKSLHVCTSEPVEAAWGKKSMQWLIRHKFPLQRIKHFECIYVFSNHAIT